MDRDKNEIGRKARDFVIGYGVLQGLLLALWMGMQRPITLAALSLAGVLAVAGSHSTRVLAAPALPPNPKLKLDRAVKNCLANREADDGTISVIVSTRPVSDTSNQRLFGTYPVGPTRRRLWDGKALTSSSADDVVTAAHVVWGAQVVWGTCCE